MILDLVGGLPRLSPSSFSFSASAIRTFPRRPSPSILTPYLMNKLIGYRLSAPGTRRCAVCCVSFHLRPKSAAHMQYSLRPSILASATVANRVILQPETSQHPQHFLCNLTLFLSMYSRCALVAVALAGAICMC